MRPRQSRREASTFGLKDIFHRVQNCSLHLAAKLCRSGNKTRMSNRDRQSQRRLFDGREVN